MVFSKMCSRRPSLFLVVVVYVCLSCGLAFARMRMLLDAYVVGGVCCWMLLSV